MRGSNDRGTSMLDFFSVETGRNDFLCFFIYCGTAWERVWLNELGVLFYFFK